MKKVLLLLMIGVLLLPVVTSAKGGSFSSSRSFSSGSSFRSSSIKSYSAPRVSSVKVSTPKSTTKVSTPKSSVKSPNETMNSIKSQPYTNGNVYVNNYNPFSGNFIFYYWLFGGFNHNNEPTKVATTTITK